MVKFVFELLEIPFLFFQYVVSDQRRDKGTRFFGRDCIQQNVEIQTFWLAAGPPHPNSIPKFHLLMDTPHKDDTEEDA